MIENADTANGIGIQTILTEYKPKSKGAADLQQMAFQENAQNLVDKQKANKIAPQIRLLVFRFR